ncbi:hypothetical protein C1752_00686 [Acaryochloris thomasi RCC1774]|uniref:Uncharacterized protein n=1 Tax=Acaryochloris thomasi RCC1774 TaxID=1764569 RepID=A0A2W1JNI5_9CYAN|nr:hypothetical protein [Acaryochloris thomasi]PZD74893.1 hypothetical protein C1752_00686 [Acaryochloris thomasi RCC1774]
MSISAEFNQTSVLPKQKQRSPKISELLQGWLQKNKTHHYQSSNAGLDFSIEESTEGPKEIQMISQKPGVKKDDQIKIHDVSESITYKVLDIDFYSNVEDMWVAKLAVLADQ